MHTSGVKTIWIAVLIVTVALVAFPRFDRQDIGPIGKFTGKIDGKPSLGDAVFYMNYVDYFRGNAELEDVELPFRYRPLIPMMASILPIESPMTAINVINVIALYLTIFVLFKLFQKLGFDFGLSLIGCFLYAVSFPVFYMSTTGYLEACSMCLLATGTYLVFCRRWLFLLLTLVAGLFVKEVVVLLIPIAVVYLWINKSGWKTLLIWSIVFVGAFVFVTAMMKEMFGHYIWIPNVETLLFNLRPRALFSLGLSFGLPGVLAVIFFLRYRRLSARIGSGILLPIFTGILFTLLLVVYSMVTAYADGRYIWPAVVFTIPLSLWVIEDWSASAGMGRAKTGIAG
ncbi:MAG: hypothetical protein ABIK83_10080 [Candidatus Zixiibacteriota bacterium]|nr:hypothetical protein [candidate division Zixibacteria bacterium]